MTRQLKVFLARFCECMYACMIYIMRITTCVCAASYMHIDMIMIYQDVYCVICIYIYIYIYIYVHTYIYIYIYICLHRYMQNCKMYVYYACTYNTHAHAYTYKDDLPRGQQRLSDVCVRISALYIHTHTHAYIYIQ